MPKTKVRKGSKSKINKNKKTQDMNQQEMFKDDKWPVFDLMR